MSNDRYANIRKALAMGPTPGPFSTVRSYSPGNQELILSLTYKDEHGITENYCTVRNRLGDTWKTEANAAYIAACDPDTIRALLAARDALTAEVERLRDALEEIRNRSSMGVMRSDQSDQSELEVVLGDICLFVDAVLWKEKNDECQ